MSARYVWGKNNIKYPAVTFQTTDSVTPRDLRPTYTSEQCGGTFCSDYSRVVVDGKLYFKPEGTMKGFVFSAMIDGGRHSCATYPYFIAADNGNLPGWALARSGSGYWTIDKSSRSVEKTNYDSWDKLDFDLAMYSSASEIGKGSFIEYKSSNNSNEYPQNGIQDPYYYEYKGSDSIDPRALMSSKIEVYPGDSLTITVSPREPALGGTVYYQYQYSTDGRKTWENLGGKTTDTSKTITISEDMEKFQARVLASDGWGFTSETYIYGASNISILRVKAYATMEGKNRAGAKMYDTVGGKIRQVQKGYVTVGGKVRKLF